ncbi:MAG: DMT family transporter [Geminicoccaceae bacterium]|nr:MAG: DMT family transporter [Geminicoccaceae bacterium]
MAHVVPVVASNALGIPWALFAFGAFATNDAIVKWVSAVLPVMQIAFVLTLGSLLPVMAVIWREGGFRDFWPSVPGLVALRALFATTSALLAFSAFARLPLADVYALIFTIPLWVTILSVPVLGEQVGWRRTSAVVVGFVGVLVMVRPGEASLEVGHLMAAGCALCASSAYLVTRRIGGRARGGTQLLAVSVAMLAVTAPSTLLAPPAAAPSTFALLLAGGMLQGIAQFAIWQALKLSPASVVVPFQYSQLLWAVVYGYLLFDAWPDRATLLGATIVIASGLYIMQRERRLGRQVRVVV